MPDEAPPARSVLIGGERLAEAQQPRRSPPGEKFHPQDLVEARQRLGAQVSQARQAEQELPDALRGERIVLEARLLPNYLAPTQHPQALRDDADLVVVGTRGARAVKQTARQRRDDAPTKTLLVAATAHSLERLDLLLNTPGAYASDEVFADLIKFDDIVVPGSEQVVVTGSADNADPDEEVAWEAVLHPALDAQGNRSARVSALIMRRWAEWLEQLGGEIHTRYVRTAGPLTYMPVRLRRSALAEAARFNPLRVLRPAPRLRATVARGARRVADVAPAAPARVPASPTRIAVFDGGVDITHPLLAPFVTEQDLTPAPRTEEWVEHGTLVTSAALYGHLPTGTTPTQPPAYVDHFRVLPAPSTVADEDEPYWFLEQIKPVLESGDYEVISLSYGPEVPVDEDEVPDLFTATIDELAYQHDLTVLNAVGNNGLPEPSPLGGDRVMAPADAVNGLGVGSCEDPHPRATPTRAQYSCVGPGRHGLAIQPAGVMFGGRDDARFVGAAPGGGMQAHMGTSYATPTAARACVTLDADQLSPQATIDAATRRALMMHFTEGLDEDALVEVGLGRFPDDLRPRLLCAPNTVTVVVNDMIARGDTKGYALPFPAGGLSGAFEISWTVAMLSPVDPTDPFEYTLAGLQCSFRPCATMFRWTNQADRSENKTFDRRHHQALIAAHEARGWTRSRNPVTRSPKAIRSHATEPEQTQWETAVHYRQGIQGRTMHLPEIWLQANERDRGQLVPRSRGMDVEFAMVMTVAARRDDVGLYDAVLADARFAALSPILATVPIRVPGT